MHLSPSLRYILYQVVAWVSAYLLLAVMVMLLFKSERVTEHLNLLVNIGSALVFGGVQGVIFGFAEPVLEARFNKMLPLGLNILLRVLFYFVSTMIILSLFRYLVYDHFIHRIFSHYMLSDNSSWRYVFYLTILYNFVVSVIISFTVQVSKKFGPGMMLPLLSGKYLVPKEEHKIFVFMDLKSSTMIAEQLGHIQYSAFISDCFWDINITAANYRGTIYQYVGDEVVITWNTNNTDDNTRCIEFFFATVLQFNKRADYYLKRYGLVPEFKAGAHSGKVIAVEIGETKRDIAYHGDTLNTASRIQALCNDYNQSLLISRDLMEYINHSRYNMDSLGTIYLKGKTNETEIFSVAKIPDTGTNSSD